MSFFAGYLADWQLCPDSENPMGKMGGKWRPLRWMAEASGMDEDIGEMDYEYGYGYGVYILYIYIYINGKQLM